MADIGIMSEASRNYVFEWKICDFFSFTKESEVYYSSKFHVLNSLWNIWIYPNGNNKDDAGYVSLYLHSVNNKTTMIMDYTFGFKNKSNIIVNELQASWKPKNASWGWPKFIKRSELELKMADLVPSGNLTVVCNLTVKSSGKDFDMKLNQLVEGVATLCKSKENSDVSIKIDNETIFAHRSILAARCPFFDAMFKNEMLEKKTGVVNITDCDVGVFNTLLQFLYSGKVEFQESSVFDLYKIADKYDVSELAEMCIDFMIRNLSVENVCKMFEFSVEFDKKRLQSFARIFFCENFQQIVLSDAWESFMEENCSLANGLLKKMAPKVKIVL